MGIPFDILPDHDESALTLLDSALYSIKHRNTPFALVVRKNTFAPYKF